MSCHRRPRLTLWNPVSPPHTLMPASRLHICISDGGIVALGPLEQRVLGALWRIASTITRAASVEEVRVVVQAVGPDVAYNTVAATLTRLCAKKLVRRTKARQVRKGGQAHWRYRPALTRAELDAVTLDVVIAALVAFYGREAVSAAASAASYAGDCADLYQ